VVVSQIFKILGLSIFALHALKRKKIVEQEIIGYIGDCDVEHQERGEGSIKEAAECSAASLMLISNVIRD